MRIFRTFPEAIEEIKRDLKEMGIKVDNTHMQDKVGSFPTFELMNYGFTVLEPKLEDLNPTQPWADREWEDRLEGILGSPTNPGRAYVSRSDEHMDWGDFLELGDRPIPEGVSMMDFILQHPHLDHERAKLSYTYSERLSMGSQVLQVIRELHRNPDSRQLYVSMWDPNKDIERIGIRRVPCSLGWHFLKRQNQLNITYSMRSCDFVTHFQNDCWLTLKLLDYVCTISGIPVGRYSQFINSFHVYQKDVEDVF